ncbi:YkvA family protein [Nocardiopsis sp. CT-R113]|uniref:YkvA family protein n=1 Tax=Nocardiopsis codii TaxID=3065942 RepID=A0ABU7K1U4_9ACTN|nr:YkvA family protein [Nocardiopsis sp. CT-R113]MEE2035819.1 YkvA family protein [Nocardiopsis sp. CT-R113]
MRKANRAAAGAAAWQVIQNTDTDVSVWKRVGAVPRMLGAKMRGRYPDLTSPKLLGMLALALYIISPIDFVPELFIPLLGLADDVGVAVWLTTMALGESERFVRWERQNQAQQAFHQANQAGRDGARPDGPGQADPGHGGFPGHDVRDGAGQAAARKP